MKEELEVALAAGWQGAAYQLLPLRLVSRLWGGLHELTLPPPPGSLGRFLTSHFAQ